MPVECWAAAGGADGGAAGGATLRGLGEDNQALGWGDPKAVRALAARASFSVPLRGAPGHDHGIASALAYSAVNVYRTSSTLPSRKRTVRIFSSPDRNMVAGT